MINTVFVDMDGVMNKFSSYALQYVGAFDGILDYMDYPEECQTWDIVKSANCLSKANVPDFSSNKFWDALDQTFWETIPTEYYLWRMIDYLSRQVGEKNVCVASTPTLGPESLSGKLVWIKKNLPSYMRRQYMFGRDKFLLARPDTLLIDDNQDNCIQFERAGGRSILVPRPWNNLFSLLTASDPQGWFYVSRRLNFYFEGVR
jgi:5'(3')-deoxyribonucleotidase